MQIKRITALHVFKVSFSMIIIPGRNDFVKAVITLQRSKLKIVVRYNLITLYCSYPHYFKRSPIKAIIIRNLF